MIWYCDSSALVKRYVSETGSRWLRQQVGKHRLSSSVIVIPEVASALARRHRQGTLSLYAFYRDRALFDHRLRTNQYLLLLPTLTIIDQAADLIYRHPLAAYDAVHLATALDYLAASGTAPKQFFFVTADDQLQRAAAAEGLPTENPNAHP